MEEPQPELPAEQIQVLQYAFNAFDVEKKGSIGLEMVKDILGMLGVTPTEEMLEEIVAEVDADGSGEFEFDEFIVLASRFLIEEDLETVQAELREAFRFYDRDGNGYITVAVFREILRELDGELTNDELDNMIEEIDTDGSGTVDIDEFLAAMTG